MSDASPTNPKILIGASIPRSGHHFLADMMTGYFGPDLYYCEFYTLPSCCKHAPCTRRGPFSYIYQKSHDRDFTLPADVAEALYLIQYRHPVPEALSDRELDLKDSIGRPSLSFRRTRAGYMMWLAAKALYYRRFHDKWMAKRLPNALYLDYPELAAKPMETMRAILARAGADLDETKLTRVVNANSKPRAAAGGEAFKPRVVSDSPHFDAELLGALEAWILERCPAYGFSSELGGSYEESELYGMILLRDQQEPLPRGESKRFKAAAKYAPDHPEVQRRLALRALREGHTKQGLTRLEKLLAAHPFFGPGYELLFSACADSGSEVPESTLNGNALIACSDDPDLLLALGSAFRAKGLGVNAAAAFSLASMVAPANEDARARLAETLDEVRR
jgi:hypothetical protein